MIRRDGGVCALPPYFRALLTRERMCDGMYLYAFNADGEPVHMPWLLSPYVINSLSRAKGCAAIAFQKNDEIKTIGLDVVYHDVNEHGVPYPRTRTHHSTHGFLTTWTREDLADLIERCRRNDKKRRTK